MFDSATQPGESWRTGTQTPRLTTEGEGTGEVRLSRSQKSVGSRTCTRPNTISLRSTLHRRHRPGRRRGAGRWAAAVLSVTRRAIEMKYAQT
eukprot:scaffold65323_cov56-Phaeocystis_antarctica.AAC.1